MEWIIGPKTRAHIVGFSGLNISGERWEIDIWPLGRKAQGEGFDGLRLKSIGIIAPVGVRMTLISARSKVGWETLPWRCVQVMDGFTFDTQQDRLGVQIPDLERMDLPGAMYRDHTKEFSIPQVETLAEGNTWTFGRPGRLACNVKQIIVERYDL